MLEALEDEELSLFWMRAEIEVLRSAQVTYEAKPGSPKRQMIETTLGEQRVHRWNIPVILQDERGDQMEAFIGSYAAILLEISATDYLGSPRRAQRAKLDVIDGRNCTCLVERLPMKKSKYMIRLIR